MKIIENPHNYNKVIIKESRASGILNDKLNRINNKDSTPIVTPTPTPINGMSYVNRRPNVIDAWWEPVPLPGNFGDVITPYLVRHVSNGECAFIHKLATQKHLVATGSIAKSASTGAIVWGSGIIDNTDVLSPHAIWKSVRGPITSKALYDQTNIKVTNFGDPSLLMPKFFSPNVEKKYKYGIVPHYIDKELPPQLFNFKSCKLIDILCSDDDQSIENKIKEILECEYIISSSLHGIIIAHAYGIPAVHVKMSDRLYGNGVKFDDYAQSVNWDYHKIELTSMVDDTNVGRLLYFNNAFGINVAPILESFPYKEFGLTPKVQI